MIAANTIDASIAINALKNAGINTAGMNADALGERLGQLYPGENFKIVGYTPVPTSTTQPTTIVPVGSNTATTFVNPFEPTTGATTAPATKTIVPVGTTTGGTTTTGTAQTAAPFTVTSVSYSDALDILKNLKYDPASMSQAAMETALSSAYTFPLKVTGYPGNTATTFVNPFGPTTGATTAPATKTIVPVGTTTGGTTTGGTTTGGITTGGKTGGGNPLTAYAPPASLASPTGGTTTGTTTGGTTGGGNPLTEYGPPGSLAPPITTLAPFPTTVTPPGINPFMTPGVTFPPRTQFNQQASAPLNILQQGNVYGAPAPVYTTMPVAPPPTQFKSVQPGGAIGSTGTPGAVPTFQNPFTTPALVPTSTATSFNTIGADIARNALLNKGFTQANVTGMDANQLATEMGRINPGESYKIVNFADGGLAGTNNMAGTTGMVQQFQNPFGPPQPHAGMGMYNQGQQPQQHQSISVGGTPQQLGLPGLLSTGSQNQYPQGYTPIGQAPQNFLTLNVPRN